MNRQNKIVVVLGKKGFGKTSFVVAETDAMNRLIIFDYNREYQKGKIVSTPQEMISQLRLNQQTFFRLIYRPSPEFEIETHFHFLSEICFLVPDHTFVIEEVDLVSQAGFMPSGLKKLINYGRHQAINLFCLSRRAHMVPRDLTANADVIVSFNQQEPRDVKYLVDYMGSAAEEVRTLKKTADSSEFIEWENGEFRRGKNFFIAKRISYLVN